MNKFLKKIVLALAAFAVGFGFCFVPVTSTAFAEESVQTGEQSTETAPETDSADKIEETPTEEEIEGITGDYKFDFTNLSYEDFLAFVGSFAVETGHGDDWSYTMNAIKKAIDEKQFGLAVGLIIILIVVLIWKIVADMIAKRKEKKHIETTDAQTKKINEQTVAINAQTETAKRVEEDELKTHTAIKCLCNMVLTLSSRFNIGEASKETIRAEANKIQKILGE